MGKAIRENSIGTRLGKSSKLGMPFCKPRKGLFLSVYVDDKKIVGKKQNLDPMWKALNKKVDLGEPTSFLDHVCLGCTQRECLTNKDIVDNYRNKFESKISAGATEQLIYFILRKLAQTFPHGPVIWKVMQRNAWNDIANWRINNSTNIQCSNSVP